jgi:hypothetical protein
MKLPIALVAVLMLAGPALAAPGDPRAMRGSLEWPAALSSEPIAVVRGDDGRLYYADMSTAQRIGTGPISGRVSLVGVEGMRPHEIAAVAISAGDDALSALTPAAPIPAPGIHVPAAPQPSASIPSIAVPPSAVAPSPAPTASAPSRTDDLWQVQGKVKAVTSREMAIETPRGDTVRVDVSKLSQWTRDSVRPGDQVKLFGIPQKDRRLVANGFIQEVQPSAAASPAGAR